MIVLLLLWPKAAISWFAYIDWLTDWLIDILMHIVEFFFKQTSAFDYFGAQNSLDRVWLTDAQN